MVLVLWIIFLSLINILIHKRTLQQRLAGKEKKQKTKNKKQKTKKINKIFMLGALFLI
jgi:hypothetical protein